MIELVLLVLEQEPGRRSELESALTGQGYTVRPVPDGAALLSEIGARPPHLVIIDLDLPNDDGLMLLKTVHDIMPMVPIIGETATPTVEGAVEAMRRGAYNYISKFSPMSALSDMISHALGKERMEVETKEKARERRIKSFDDQSSGAIANDNRLSLQRRAHGKNRDNQ